MTTHSDALVASDYVICATLRKVADVFNVELLWERIRGGQEGVCLMEALKRHPRTPRARQRKETRYSHVVVRIPERDYIRDDRLEDGFGRRALLGELQRLHQQELGRYLAEDGTIRYRLEPDAVLRPGEVQFLFGRAIHIPAESEAPLFRIQAAAVDGQGEWREVGLIYPGQRLTLLNGDRRAGSIAVVGWPFPGGESVLLVMRSGSPALVDVGAEPTGCLTLTDDGEGGFTARDRRARGLRLRVVALAAGVESPVAREGVATPPAPVARPVEPVHPPIAGISDPAPESLPPLTPLDETIPRIDRWGRREPVLGIPAQFDGALEPAALPDWPAPAPAPPAPQVLPKSSPPSPAFAPEPTGLDQGTWIPRRPVACLRVAGVALQRLSAYAAAGISDWRLSFNRAGGLVSDGHPEAAAWLRIDNADRVFGEVVGLSAPLDLPGMWRPFPDLELELYAAPAPMTAHYMGWVRLPAPLALPVSRERAVSFGRGSEADIAPRLLADPRSLRWDGNRPKRSGISAEYLGLSRRHLSLQARRDDWWVQLESQNMPVYRLAPSGDLLDVLNPGVNTAAAAKPGELLVAGGYVLALGAVG
ncbi:MAG: hypothetical protein RKR03_11545 [Candidatus Competibacter sp.]|nr:hypothetical protein [Candidatus Competibacter sp.]